MPMVSVELPESAMAITRRVATDVITQLIANTGIRDAQLSLSYNGNTEVAKLFNGSVASWGNNANQEDTAIFNQHGKVKISVSDEYDDELYSTMQTNRKEYPLLFSDRELRMYMRANYVPMVMRISVEYRAPDLQSMQSWRDGIRRKISVGQSMFTHELNYEFGMPPAFLMIINEVHKLRETKAPYGETFRTYFDARISNKFTLLTTLAGKEHHPAFVEKQMNVLGVFDFTVPPEKQKGEGATQTVSFDYIVKYEKPIEMQLEYPTVVHNSLLPAKFRPRENDRLYSKMAGSKSWTNMNMDTIRLDQDVYYEAWEGIRIPHFDEWTPKFEPFIGSRNLMHALVGIDAADPTLVLDLKDLGDYQIKPLYIDFLKRHHAKLSIPYLNVFNVCMYEDDVVMPEESVLIDSDLIVRYRIPLNLRKTYRVRISIMTDLSLMTDIAINDLLNDPEVCLDVLGALNPGWGKCGQPTVLADRLVSKTDFICHVGEIKTTFKHIKNTKYRGLFHVGNFIISTGR